VRVHGAGNAWECGTGVDWVGIGTVRVFRRNFALEDAIRSHACSLEVSLRVTNVIPIGCSLLLPVGTVNSIQTLKVYANSIVGIFQASTRMGAEVLARFTSVERITEYIENVPLEVSEADAASQGAPPEGWPFAGAIEIKNVTAYYREGLPPVLNQLSLSVRGGEKIGVVGRTGSGKSSLMLCLFRLLGKQTGLITIDGVDISSIDVSKLRQKLAIIPQDPVMFAGTIRYNLDPIGRHTDEDMWLALERSHVAKSVRALPGQLAAELAENGSNLSVGERQLMCMARVLLQDAKIMILDEATAAIDSQTDALIQTTIRQEFNHCTVLTIAHRLETVLDSDKVLVLGEGRVLEFDDPTVLQQQESSYFRGLLQAAAAGALQVDA
jgi:ABC-type multidrug transport system fused ATPase/permease subunit